MSSEKFIQNNLALTTLICACVVVLMSLSVRQVFGMFFIDFNNDLGISNTAVSYTHLTLPTIYSV